MWFGYLFPGSKGVLMRLKQVWNPLRVKRVDKLTFFLKFVLLKSRLYGTLPNAEEALPKKKGLLSPLL
jgi:hypothetical protein